MTNGKADLSFKFGAGRYLAGQGLLEQAGIEIARFGRKPIIIGGPTALARTRSRLAAGLETAGLPALFAEHAGAVCHEAARTIAEQAVMSACDVVVGVGGGRSMDFAKLVALYLGTRVVNIPTSIATCAAYTPFSLVYTPDGQTIPGNYCSDLEVAAVLVDLDIMAGQPVRLVVAGILDAMAKAVEVKNGHPELPAGRPLNLRAASHLAQFSWAHLTDLADQACRDVAAGQATQALEDVVFLNLPLTGMISALSRGVGQSALAHELYYQARLHFTQTSQVALHGEIVGVGLLMQMAYNQTLDQASPFRAFLRRHGAPACLAQIGISPTESNVSVLREAIKATCLVGPDDQSRRRLDQAFEQII
jgi:glycerol dehydrogenase-like iron-containing ADH family enzyme